MQKNNNTPLWVFLAFSSIEKRKHALWLIWATVVFTLYCVPWSKLLNAPSIVSKVFWASDWSWFAMMVPILIWYGLSLRWVDKNAGW